MKIITSTLILFLSSISWSKAPDPNVLLIDSSFTPIQLESERNTLVKCLLINENNIETLESGPCYDAKAWDELKSVDINLLKGFQDLLSGNKASVNALLWINFQKKNKVKARKIRNQYIVSTHGSRSAFILDKFSNGKANIRYMRNITTGIGGVTEKKGLFKNRKKYSNGCGFNNWSLSDIKSFQKGKLQPYQYRISKALTNHKSIKVVNISLGYKENWIQEDNPKCTKVQVSKEYQVLTSSWINLVERHSNVLFITAAGNESESFENSLLKKNDLWANIASSKLNNLLLVGSINENGTRFRSSNYGSIVEVMALGSNLLINSPLPNQMKGHTTTVRGTSFTTPLVSGSSIHFLDKLSSPKKIKEKLIKIFHEGRKKVLLDTYFKSCIKVDSMECLTSIMSLLSRPFLWDDTDKLFLKGKKTWSFSPFPIQYVKDLNSQAKVKLIKHGDKYIPSLQLGKADTPYDLLISIHHEIYHYSSHSKAAKHFYDNSKINNCVTKYQLSLAKDELPAFEKEISFYRKSPDWFKEGANSKKFNSKLLGKKNITYSEYYRILKSQIKKNKNFIINRYVELGEYPKCIKLLL